MKHTAYLAVLSIALGLAACGGSENKDSQLVDTLAAEVAPVSTGPSVATIRNIDTKVDGYDIHSECCVDSASVVKYEYGEYYNNEVLLTIEKDGTRLFNHTFSKADFQGDYDASKNLLVGLIYKERKEGLFVFAVEVGEPYGEGGACFLLKVDSSGGYSISVDNTQDTSLDGE